MVVGRPAQIRLVEHGALSLVVVIARLIERSVLLPDGTEEPQLVLLDRAAKPSSDVVVPFDRPRRRQATVAQIVVQIVGLQFGAGDLGLTVPENMLPPSFGMMLIWTPPVVASAEPAAVSTTTSSKVCRVVLKLHRR